jgi:prefoldin subunit 5
MGIGTGMSQTQMTRAEKETESAAERLTSQIEDARAAVSGHSISDIDELEACADRLERAARDLATALRELSHERRAAAEEAE